MMVSHQCLSHPERKPFLLTAQCGYVVKEVVDRCHLVLRIKNCAEKAH